MTKKEQVLLKNDVHFGKLNLDYALISSEPISDDDFIQVLSDGTYTLPTSEKFIEEIFQLIKIQVKFQITAISKELEKEIRLFHNRIKFQVEKVETNRELRQFYSDLRRLCKTDNHEVIIAKFKNSSKEEAEQLQNDSDTNSEEVRKIQEKYLSRKAQELILSMAEGTPLILFLKGKGNILNCSMKEITNAIKPSFPNLLHVDGVKFVSENAQVRHSLAYETDRFLERLSILFNVTLSFYSKDFIADQGGSDQAITRDGNRFHGWGVKLIKYIDKYFNLNGLFDCPTTYQKRKQFIINL